MAFDLSSLSQRYKDLLKVSCAASKSGNNFEEESIGDILIIGFCGSLNVTAFSQTTTKFGECAINENNNHFSSLVHWSAGSGKTQQALVHEEALNEFLHVWSNSDLEIKVGKALEAKKTVLLTGHSIGGAIATLATLLILEKLGKDAPVFSITFGFPLIGDEVLARAVRRQGWANHFFNVVTRGDVFARTLLAPCESVSKPLGALLPYWKESSEQMNDDDTDETMEDAPPEGLNFPEYVHTVLRHACAVVNFLTVSNMEPTNKLTAGLRPAIKLSPYRPFGYYLFCSEKGTLCVENYEAVLPILFYSLATCKDQASISAHTGYGRVHANTNIVILPLEGLPNLPLSQGAQPSAMETQLDALGLGIENTRARLALRAAGEHENKLRQNFTEVLEELDKLDRTEMTKVKLYRNRFLNHKNMSYYDAFKAHREEADFQANLNRLKLAALYDRIENLVDTHQLPDDFQCNDTLIRKGTEYRLYVEPLDIANYYRLGKHEDSGHYLRPRRYKALQQWLADKKIEDNINQPEITKNSCFWAYVEEISCSMEDPKGKQDEVKSKCDDFQNDVKKMIDRNELCVEEVLMGQSSFKELLKKLKEQGGGPSPLSSLFNMID